MGPLAKMHCTWILAYFFFLARVRSSFPTRVSTTLVPSEFRKEHSLLHPIPSVD